MSDAEMKAAAAAEAAAKKAAEKEAKELAKAEAKAAREAEKAQAKAEREAAAEAKKAEREAEKLRLKEEREAEKARKKAEREAAAAAAKAEREANRMPEQNGIRRPKPETLCGQAWAIFDDLSAQLGSPTSIGDSLAVSREKGLNDGNVRAEYARWRKFHGVTGRIAPVATEEQAAQ